MLLTIIDVVNRRQKVPDHQWTHHYVQLEVLLDQPYICIHGVGDAHDVPLLPLTVLPLKRQSPEEGTWIKFKCPRVASIWSSPSSLEFTRPGY